MVHLKHPEFDRIKVLVEEVPAYEAKGWVRMEPWERAVIPFHVDRTQVTPAVEPKRRGRKKTVQPIDEDYTS